MPYFGGANTDATTVDLLRELQRVSGVAILLTQGSYSVSVSASAGTHDGGGVVDINVAGWDYGTIWNVLKVARSMGGIAWYRTKAQGFAYHIHLVRRDCADLSPAARAQVVQYLNGQNGLATHGADDGPLGYTSVTWASYNNTSAYRPPIDFGDDPTGDDDMPTTEEILNAAIPRMGPKGPIGGATSLRATAAYLDSNLDEIRALVKASADPDEVHTTVLGITRSDEFKRGLLDAVLEVVRSDEFKAELAAGD